MSLDEELMKQLMASFREEFAERLAAISAGLLSLEQEPEPAQKGAVLEELFRHVHSLKGAARAVNLKPIEELAHGMEDVFGAAKRESIQLTASLFDLLYQGLDLVGATMASLDAGRGVDAALDLPGYLVRLAAGWRGQPIQPPQIELAAAQPPSPPPQLPSPTTWGKKEGEEGGRAERAEPAWSGETIRVPTTRLDDLMNQAGELLVTRLRIAQQVEELQYFASRVVRWQRDWQHVRSSATSFLQQSDGQGAQVLAFLEANEAQLRFLVDWLGKHARRVSEDVTRLSLVTDQLQEGVRRARMLPLATLVANFRRMIRDLAHEKGVEVALEVQGADTEMDKHILEQIKDPLMHLLRNCIDHGIEPPAERRARGKPLQGKIILRAERRGNVLVVEVSDDGTGIDTAAVREAALRRGLVSAEDAAEMSEEEVNALAFAPGVSTSSVITAVSGRGVGLDVVRRGVEALQGRVEVTSQGGQGCTFSLSLPFTLVSTHCLVVRAADQVYAVPLASVERLVAVRPRDLAQVEGNAAIHYQGHPLALVRLADILRRPDRGRPFSGEERWPALILASGGQHIAFLVEELLGEQDLVVKSLGRQLARVPNVAGATILGTGQVVLILNVADLVKSAQQTVGPALSLAEGEAASETRKTILIVDDSITTRTLEKNILTTAGYDVRLALDGQEALAALAEVRCDLVVADIAMPRMDGFDLTMRLKKDERYQQIPVILVTSLDSSEDKARGIAVGADAYIVKSTFEQDVLLETIRQLI
jgi:two-component system chemotaxis sensor kinase CheA